MHRFRLRLRSAWRRRQLDRDLEEELQFHQEMLARDHADARRRFGNAAFLKEACRDLWSLGAVEIWWQDVRYAIRTLRKNRAFTSVAVLTLALTIGANTAIFSVIDGVMLRSLPYRDSGRLAMVWTTVPRDHQDEAATSIPNYLDWKAQSRSFEDLAFYAPGGATLVDRAGRLDPESLELADVSANFFDVLGVDPQVGRVHSVGERDVVLSHDLWQRRFGAAPEILGQFLDLDGDVYRVVGVMPAGFEFPDVRVQLWRLALASQWWSRYVANRSRQAVVAFGRMVPALTVTQVQAEMSAIAAGLARQHPDTNGDTGARVVPLQAQVLGHTVPLLLWILFGAVLFVLLIACANIANLLMARGAARDREFALRSALGAGRARLVRQVLTESIVLAVVGAALGVPLALWGVRALTLFGPRNIPRLEEIRIDGPVLVFTLALAVFGGILFGLAPALRVTRAVRLQSGTVHAGMRRGVLVVAEFGLAMVLLTSAGLLIRSFTAVLAVDPGLRPEHVVTMELNLRYNNAFYEEVMARIRALPGVQSVGAINDIFFGRGGKSLGADTLMVEGHPREPRNLWQPLVITPNSGDAFQALGMRLLKGRLFSVQDHEHAPLVVIVNEAMARRFWPGEDPVGKRFKGYPGNDQDWVTVIGLVQDVRNLGLEKQAVSQMFAAPRQFKPGSILVVRAATPAAQLVASVRGVVRAMDPRAAIGKVSTLEQQLYDQTSQRRFQSYLLGLFSILALLLAGVGIYGLLHYSVAQRTREIGVRMALGARAEDVVGLVLREGLVSAVTGIALGTLGALVLSQAIASMLFGVKPVDPPTFLAVAALLSAVAMLACYLPARKATRVDPMSALRSE